MRRILPSAPALALALLAAGPRVLADVPDESAPPAPPAPPPVVVAVVEGDGVNLRVGPRQDGQPVGQLEAGTPVLVVERVGEWVGVRVPQGFPAAVSLQYAEAEGEDAVRITGSGVNLRQAPPEEDRPMPAAFRDSPARGTLLTLIERTDGWAWVVAPEEVRAYVHGKYLRELGPLAEHADVVAAARSRREQETKMLSAARRALASARSGESLMAEVSAVQDALQRLRLEGNQDKAPLVLLADRLDAALGSGGLAPARVLAIARALREDVEGEIAIAVARRDAELARLKGLPPVPVPTPAPKRAEVEVVGEIRYEATPGWRDPGIYLLWVDGKPALALRLTVGGDLPHPDLKAACDGAPRLLRGAQPGERLFGFPVLDVKSLRPVERPPDRP